MASKKKSTKKSAPWERPAPKSAHHTSLTPQQKQHAKARAKKAGRSYPNMVDNMHEATESRGAHQKATKRKAAAKKTPVKKTSAKKAPAKKAPAKKSAGKRAPTKRARPAARVAHKASPTKDPKGGLTAAGRKAFHERDGSNLKPGVMKSERDMTVQEMRRKGSWAARFYGRSGELPPLQGADGKPTRLALTAAAWGEPVPKTEAQARAIAAKGRRLLERARAAEA